MKQTVTVGYGKANLSNVMATYSCMKVTPPFLRVSAATSGAKVGAQNVISVGQYEMNGVLISNNVQHENGTVIMVMAMWKRGAASLRDGVLFLRLRHNAPSYNIVAKVPTGQDNICGDSFTVFSGMADIMNADELAAIGIDVERSYVSRFMDEEELEECFQITQLSKGTERPALTEITTHEGTTLKEIPQLPSRRLIFRKGP